MQRVSIQLLGSFTALDSDGNSVTLRRKTRALLAYLATSDERPSRQQLIDLFCAEASDPAGVLRSLLSRIRRQLHGELILVDGSLVTLNENVVTIDCRQFAAIVEAAVDASALAAAAELYRGDFLAGLSLRDAPAFEFWLLAERNRWRAQYELVLQRLTEMSATNGDLDNAISFARKWLTLNPLLELAHGYLITLFAQTGRFDAARQQYEQCRQILATELAVEPNETLRQLFADVQKGQLRPAEGRLSDGGMVRVERRGVRGGPGAGLPRAAVSDRVLVPLVSGAGRDGAVGAQGRPAHRGPLRRHPRRQGPAPGHRCALLEGRLADAGLPGRFR